MRIKSSYLRKYYDVKLTLRLVSGGGRGLGGGAGRVVRQGGRRPRLEELVQRRLDAELVLREVEQRR